MACYRRLETPMQDSESLLSTFFALQCVFILHSWQNIVIDISQLCELALYSFIEVPVVSD